MASDSWPPSHGLSTIIVPRKNATLSVSASTRIAAPAALVYQCTTDLAHFESWNSFCPEAKFRSRAESAAADSEDESLREGDRFTLWTVMDPAKKAKKVQNNFIVGHISTPDDQSNYVDQEMLNNDKSFRAELDRVYRISWSVDGGLASRGLSTERFSEVYDLGDGECEFRTWENMGGFLARTVKWLYHDTLNKRFDDWCQDLKKECERRVAEGSSATK